MHVQYILYIRTHAHREVEVLVTLDGSTYISSNVNLEVVDCKVQ